MHIGVNQFLSMMSKLKKKTKHTLNSGSSLGDRSDGNSVSFSSIEMRCFGLHLISALLWMVADGRKKSTTASRLEMMPESSVKILGSKVLPSPPTGKAVRSSAILRTGVWSNLVENCENTPLEEASF